MDDSSTQLQHQAILAALSSNWEEALKLNLLIIDTDPNNVEALNRIGRAYFERKGEVRVKGKGVDSPAIY